MKLRVIRTSNMFSQNPPFKGAHEYYDDGHYKEYDMEINSIEELIEFSREHGPLVIDKNFQPGNGPEFLVEIYDTYRE